MTQIKRPMKANYHLLLNGNLKLMCVYVYGEKNKSQIHIALG